MLEITPQIREQLIESEEYDEKRPGDDPSQIFQIREYREGDRMQRIHWKASARTSQLMVKDYSMPIGLGALLLFDLQVPEESGAVFLDQAIEYGLAILQGFLNQEYPPRAAWYNCRTQNMEQIEIRETEDRKADWMSRNWHGKRFFWKKPINILIRRTDTVSVCGLLQMVSGGRMGS